MVTYKLVVDCRGQLEGYRSFNDLTERGGSRGRYHVMQRGAINRIIGVKMWRVHPTTPTLTYINMIIIIMHDKYDYHYHA